MTKLAIIADDLTGALDSSAPFADIGKVIAATRPEALESALGMGGDVIAVSTRSREIGPNDAYQRVLDVMRQLPPGIRVFKKIDSRLKGNIAAELEAFTGRDMLVAPAIPDFQRIVIDGVLSGFGISAPMAVADCLGRFGQTAQIPDVRTETDMLAAIETLPNDTVLVGARGLAMALRQTMPGKSPGLGPLPAPMVFAIGSTDPITRAQVRTLRQSMPNLRVIDAPAGQVPPVSAPDDTTLLQMTPGATVSNRAAANSFAAGATPLLRRAKTMLLTGGATAEAMLDELNIDVLSVAGEILPGLPCCRAGNQTIITKSGGFGDADTLHRLVDLSELKEHCSHA